MFQTLSRPAYNTIIYIKVFHMATSLKLVCRYAYEFPVKIQNEILR